MKAPQKRLSFENGHFIDVFEKWVKIDGVVYCVWFHPTAFKEPPVIEIDLIAPSVPNETE